MAAEKFISGRELSHLFFDEQVAPILTRRLPKLKYGAGLFGSGADVLGYDTFRSMDHDWGPRLQVFEGLDVSSYASLCGFSESRIKYRRFVLDG